MLFRSLEKSLKLFETRDNLLTFNQVIKQRGDPVARIGFSLIIWFGFIFKQFSFVNNGF